MFYVARGEHPAHASHPAPRARRQPLRGGAVRRRGVHRSKLAPLPRDAADADAQDRARGGDPRSKRPTTATTTTDSSRPAAVEPAGRCRHRPRPAVLQQRRRHGRRPARRGRCPRRPLLPQRRGGRDALRPRGRRAARHGLRAAPLRPRRLPRAADRDDLAPRPGRRQRPADAVARVPVGDRAAEALPQRLRPAARALALLAARHPGARRRSRPRTDAGDFVVHVKMRGRLTAYHYRTTRSTSSAGTATSGRSPSTSPTSSRSPAASTSRRRSTRRSQARNFVVCSFVPRKFDYHPLAIPAPYNHSNINSDEVIYYVAGNFMSRRGRRASRRSRSIRPASRTARIRARPRPRSARRRPRSWPSWSTRSTRSPDHAAGGRARGRPLPVLVAAAPRTPAARPRAARSAGRRRSRTEPPLSSTRAIVRHRAGPAGAMEEFAACGRRRTQAWS